MGEWAGGVAEGVEEAREEGEEEVVPETRDEPEAEGVVGSEEVDYAGEDARDSEDMVEGRHGE